VVGESFGSDHARAELRHRAARARIADGRVDPDASRGRDLDGSGPDSAGAALNQQALTRGQFALAEQRVVGGREDLGDPARRLPADASGHGHQLALVHDRQLGLAAAADDAHHAIAEREAPGFRAQGRDVAGELEARYIGRRAGRSGIATGELVHVGSVQSGGANAHENLARAGLRIGML
jgi:hypothetical protein